MQEDTLLWLQAHMTDSRKTFKEQFVFIGHAPCRHSLLSHAVLKFSETADRSDGAKTGSV